MTRKYREVPPPKYPLVVPLIFLAAVAVLAILGAFALNSVMDISIRQITGMV